MIYNWIIKLLATNIHKVLLPTHKGKSFIGCSYVYQNPYLDPMILWSHLPKMVWILVIVQDYTILMIPNDLGFL